MFKQCFIRKSRQKYNMGNEMAEKILTVVFIFVGVYALLFGGLGVISCLRSNTIMTLPCLAYLGITIVGIMIIAYIFQSE